MEALVYAGEWIVSKRNRKKTQNQRIPPVQRQEITVPKAYFVNKKSGSSTIMGADVGGTSSRRARASRKGGGSRKPGAHVGVAPSSRNTAVGKAALYGAIVLALTLTGSPQPAHSARESKLHGMDRVGTELRALKTYTLPRQRCRFFKVPGSFARRVSGVAGKTGNYRVGEHRYVVPEEIGGNSPGRTAVAIAVDPEGKMITFGRVRFPEPGSGEAVPLPGTFSIDYSQLGVGENPQVGVEEVEGEIVVSLFNTETKKEARFSTLPVSTSPENTWLVEYQELTAGFVKPVFGSLHTLPGFGTTAEKSHLAGMFSEARARAQKKLEGLSGIPLDVYMHGGGMSTMQFASLFRRYTSAYREAFDSAWNFFTGKTVAAKGKKAKEEILDEGLRMLLAMILRPHLADNPRYLRLLDAAMEQGLSEKSFKRVLKQVSEERKYSEICDIFRKDVEAQVEGLLRRRRRN